MKCSSGRSRFRRVRYAQIESFTQLTLVVNYLFFGFMIASFSAYDLPQRPNEAQIFYSNMSKVMLSLFGTVEMSDSGESDHMESIRPSQRQASESDG